MKQTADKKSHTRKATARQATPKPQDADQAQTAEPEVLPAEPERLPAATPDRSETDAILGVVRQDIANAEVGRFFALRAGVGLIVVKELCAHGEWSQEMLRMIPDRSPRTLRLYMANARGFLDDRALMARDVWPKLAGVGSTALGAAAARMLLGDGSSNGPDDPAVDVPDEIHAMAEWLREDKTVSRSQAAEGGRTLSAAEKRQAAAGLWQSMAGRVVDEGIKRGSWQLLDAETLETVASAFRTVADKMMQSARKAARKTASH